MNKSIENFTKTLFELFNDYGFIVDPLDDSKFHRFFCSDTSISFVCRVTSINHHNIQFFQIRVRSFGFLKQRFSWNRSLTYEIPKNFCYDDDLIFITSTIQGIKLNLKLLKKLWERDELKLEDCETIQNKSTGFNSPSLALSSFWEGNWGNNG